MSNIHTYSIGANNHNPFRWIVNNAAERLAIDLSDSIILSGHSVADELNKICYQKDNSTVWILGSTSPITWLPVTSGGAVAEFQQNITDNTTNIFVVGSTLNDRKITIDYTIETIDGLKFEGGRFIILHNNTITVNNGSERLGTPSIFNEIDFDSDIANVNEIRLKLVVAGVGQNLKLKYTISKITKFS